MNTLSEWATCWGVSPMALKDLTMRMAGPVPTGTQAPGSEAAVQQAVRLEASKRGARLWRNNNGACKDENGRQIRYGLANDSRQVNARIKSHDLIGITPLLVTPGHVGDTVGVFTSIECKRPGWRYTGTPREVAQSAWGAVVESLGGVSKFVSDVREY